MSAEFVWDLPTPPRPQGYSQCKDTGIIDTHQTTSCTAGVTETMSKHAQHHHPRPTKLRRFDMYERARARIAYYFN